MIWLNKNLKNALQAFAMCLLHILDIMLLYLQVYFIAYIS